jgi:hypothetical protein
MVLGQKWLHHQKLGRPTLQSQQFFLERKLYLLMVIFTSSLNPPTIRAGHVGGEHKIMLQPGHETVVRKRPL